MIYCSYKSYLIKNCYKKRKSIVLTKHEETNSNYLVKIKINKDFKIMR